MQHESREHQRRTLQVEIDLHSHDNFYAGITGDVSEGGLFVATYTPPEIGSLVDLDMTLPGGFRLQARGQVRWIRSVDAARDGNMPGCGVRFVSIAPEAVREIRQFVCQRETLYFDDDSVFAA